MRTLVLSAIIAACVFWPSASSLASSFPDKYDRQIERAVDRWWPDFPFWKAWKSQLYQESLLNPDAVSHAGARGIAQFMPKTWEQVRKALGWGLVSPHDADLAIEAGSYYMATLRKTWRAPRPELDRHWLAASSYNAGTGNILKAQRLCGGANLYPDIIACLPQVTGRHAEETIGYVARIKRWWRLMELG